MVTSETRLPDDPRRSGLLYEVIVVAGFECTFRTLCRPSEVILEEPTVEGGSGALDRRFHAL